MRCLRLTWHGEIIEIQLRIVIRLRYQVHVGVIERQLRLRRGEHLRCALYPSSGSDDDDFEVSQGLVDYTTELCVWKFELAKIFCVDSVQIPEFHSAT